MKPLDIRELQNRLDAISEAQVNEFYVKSARDVLTTLPAFAYRASDPVDDQPEDKMYTAAVGERAEMLYNKLRKWLAAGNDFSEEEIEALDQAASAPEFMGPTSETDDQDVIDMLNSGLDTLEDIIGDKTESVEEDDMSTGTAGGVAGQGKKRRATGINDNPYDHNEGQDLAALVNAALWNMKDVYQTVLAGEELSEEDIFSYGDLVQYLEMEELPDTYSEFYDLVSDAIDSASGGGEFNPGDAIAVDKNIAPKIKTLYQQFKAATAKIEGIKEDSVEEYSVQEGDSELEELKSALGRTGGVMGFKN